jgi:hypothetical protein
MYVPMKSMYVDGASMYSTYVPTAYIGSARNNLFQLLWKCSGFQEKDVRRKKVREKNL